MTSSINVHVYSDALVLLGTAGVVIPLVRRFGFNPVLGYLGAGAILGPLGLGSFIDKFPFLYWFTVVDPANVSGIANLGVVFLLFLIGMELSYDRLKAMHRLIFGLGSLQIILSTVVIGLVAALAGSKAPVALILGACLALSSTAIVVEILSRQKRLNTSAGRASFAVLLAQDLAVAPLLLFITIFGAGDSGSVIATLALALTNAAIALGVIVVVGRVVMRPLFRLVASVGMSDLFVATTLFVIVATGVAAAVAGFSMALGAFVAGLLLAETEFRKAIETAIDPFKGLLLGLFFFTVGMNIDFRQIARDPIWLIAGAAALIAVKSTILVFLARMFRLSWPASIEVGLLLGPGGEFAFVAIGMATTLGLIDANLSSFAVALTTLTMMLTPALSHVARQLAPMVREDKPLDPELTVAPSVGSGHAIVVGHGRVGQVVCTMLDRHQFKYIAVDNDAAAVPEQRRQGRTVFYGDATNPEFLKSCGLMDAAAVIVTINEAEGIDEIVAQVRALRKDILIVSRARDADHARHLYRIGVTDAVPETIEASLLLSEAALIGLGVAMGLVVASVHEKREEFRHELQQAAGSVASAPKPVAGTKRRRLFR
ncbi:cation:proton antiporter [Bradyrhizobium sp. WSM 1738]|uniref:cation:proton antiporter domain-containing protein n=1 Tax=Bradyrhizobium hereditatis TaxID=2821405 RepID=UPI001CE27151|nr:cation:proton antiporter [Bradyrhizobium hereditatis]MCA6118531.1 cation:proton antiporter [Bradyrhizobium hereditatis]